MVVVRNPYLVTSLEKKILDPIRDCWKTGERYGIFYEIKNSMKQIEYGIKTVPAKVPTVDITIFGFFENGKYLPIPAEYLEDIKQEIIEKPPQEIRSFGVLSPEEPWKRCFVGDTTYSRY